MTPITPINMDTFWQSHIDPPPVDPWPTNRRD